jgi:hypothetical protein
MDCFVIRPQGHLMCYSWHLNYYSLSSPFQAALSQTIRDTAINDLAGTMSDAYAFLCEADQVKRFKSQADILIAMAKQTEECAYFIRGYAQTKSFRTSSSAFSWFPSPVTLSFPQ